VPKPALQRLMRRVCNSMHAQPYHNFEHVCDVTQAVYMMVRAPTAVRFLPEHHRFAVLLAAIMHDLDHPGYSNLFLKHSSHALSLRYGPEGTLEKHHATLALALLDDPATDVLQGCDPSERAEIRRLIEKCILATDMSRHRAIVDDVAALMPQHYEATVTNERHERLQALAERPRAAAAAMRFATLDVPGGGGPLRRSRSLSTSRPGSEAAPPDAAQRAPAPRTRQGSVPNLSKSVSPLVPGAVDAHVNLPASAADEPAKRPRAPSPPAKRAAAPPSTVAPAAPDPPVVLSADQSLRGGSVRGGASARKGAAGMPKLKVAPAANATAAPPPLLEGPPPARHLFDRRRGSIDALINSGQVRGRARARLRVRACSVCARRVRARARFPLSSLNSHARAPACSRALAPRAPPRAPPQSEAVLLLFIKAADLSNVARPAHANERWVSRIYAEFHRQARAEAQSLYPPSPGMAEADSVAKGQIFFGKAICRPLFVMLANVLPEAGPLLDQLDLNLERWGQAAALEDGVALAQPAALAAPPSAPPPFAVPLTTIADEASMSDHDAPRVPLSTVADAGDDSVEGASSKSAATAAASDALPPP
jgi:hypothetical protein